MKAIKVRYELEEDKYIKKIIVEKEKSSRGITANNITIVFPDDGYILGCKNGDPVNFINDNNIKFNIIEFGIGLKEIQSYSFIGIEANEIRIPFTIEKIDANAFSLSEIKNIVINEYCSNLIIEKEAFSESEIEKINIPGCVKRLPSGCFKNCRELKYIYFPPISLCTSIDNYCFSGSGLEEMEVPFSVAEIKEAAFACSELKNIVFNEHSILRYIGYKAFFNCGLSKINLKSDMDRELILEEGCFHSCRNLKNADLSQTQIKKIPKEAFYGCHITDVIFPESLEYIDQRAFYRNNLKEIYLPKNLKEIGPEAFLENDISVIQNIDLIFSIKIENNSFQDNPISPIYYLPD